jgi:hypothetical protein
MLDFFRGRDRPRLSPSVPRKRRIGAANRGPKLAVQTPASSSESRRRMQTTKNRAGNRVRTDDLLITNQLLYQLSYAGVGRTLTVHGIPQAAKGIAEPSASGSRFPVFGPEPTSRARRRPRVLLWRGSPPPKGSRTEFGSGGQRRRIVGRRALLRQSCQKETTRRLWRMQRKALKSQRLPFPTRAQFSAFSAEVRPVHSRDTQDCADFVQGIPLASL